ncbi:MAG: hemerythrin domain-containing protein [Sphingomonadaceae bacterium]|nr:hemerythrin domain-containing protein [Sphingomonadaceae bacterium]
MAAEPRALTLVQEEHRAILNLFDQLGAGDGGRAEVVEEALVRLDVLQALKRELLYPALGAVDEDAVEELMDGSDEIEDLLDELDEADEPEEDEDSDGPDFAGVADQLRAHFEREEETLKELAGRGGVDLDALGAEMEQRRDELRREIGETGQLREDA